MIAVNRILDESQLGYERITDAQIEAGLQALLELKGTPKE
jgi:hypothetical protein